MTPYVLLLLVLLDEHYAMWLLYFFIIPLWDIFFYVEPPHKLSINHTWYKLCTTLWFPAVFYSLSHSFFSLKSVISFGILNNTLLCFSDNLSSSSTFDQLLQNIVYDYMIMQVSMPNTILFFLFFLYTNNLALYIFSIILGTFFYEYFQSIKNYPYPETIPLDYYGLSDYVLFNFQPQKLPTCPLWCIFYKLV